MCLICGNVACGRPQWHGGTNVIQSQGHALQHYEETGHSFAQQLDSQRVWDYRADRYSARLLLGGDVGDDGGDGSEEVGDFLGSPSQKLVEVPGPDGVEELTQVEAQEALSLEYTHELTTHLEAQRRKYENILLQTRRRCQSQIRQAEHDVCCAQTQNEDLAGKIDTCSVELKDGTSRLARLAAETDKACKGRDEEEKRVAMLTAANLKWPAALHKISQECEQTTTHNAERIQALQDELSQLMQNL